MLTRLKSLELQGYKTFANRNLFKFPHSITSVVGPNGSGKSNVADAIRWVLGEQSFSLLRARKTEDMIFAGSDQRPRAGMASATITFDNEDGWLPLDFSEVSISRRAYRDGQNEYLINGQRVRLKEIYELLSQTGLAQRTYTIVGQGLVDTALSLKPDERRRFFEEAAGIGLYRDRREEAQDRLVNTKRNLERVYDILGELEPRLTSLEKQAKKVQDYHRIQADLKVLMREWYGYHWHKSQQDLAYTRTTLQAQEEKYVKVKTRYDTFENEINQKRAKIQSLRETLSQLHLESSKLHQERETYNRQLAVMAERIRVLSEQRLNLKADLTRMDEDKETQLAKNIQLAEEINQLEADLHEARGKFEEESQKLKEYKTNKEAIEAKLVDNRRQRTSLETKKLQLDAKTSELKSRVETLTASRQNYEKGILQIDEELKSHQNALSDSETAVQALEKQLSTLRDQLRVLRESIASQQENNQRLRKILGDKESLASKLRATLEVLIQAEKSFSGLNEGAKNVLEKRRSGQFSARLEPLVQQLEVEPEFEKAITSALGEFFDAIVYYDKSVPDDPLKLLADGRKGKAVFVPSEIILSEYSFAKVKNDPDYLGAAIEHVKADKSLQNLVQYLLGNVVLASSLPGAKRIAAKLDPYQRVVTLDGELFWGSGIVVAGREGREGMIARPRQKRENQESLDLLTTELGNIQKELVDLNQALEKTIKDEKALTDQEKQLQSRLHDANRNYQQVQLKQDQLKQKHEFYEQQIASLDDQAKVAQSEQALKQSEADQLLQQIQRHAGIINDLYKQSQAISLDEGQMQVSHWQTQLAVYNRALTETRQRLQENESNLNHAAETLEKNRKRLSDLENEIEELEKSSEIDQDEEKRLTIAIEEFQAKITPSERDLSETEADYNRQQNDLTAAQQNLAVADRYVSQAQMDVTRKRELLDNLQKRIEDDFGLVSFDYVQDISGPKPLPLDGMVQQLPVVEKISSDVEDSINRHRTQLRRMGAINPEAQTEYQSVKERFEYLTNQVNDLKKADADLCNVIEELNEIMKLEFQKTFEAVSVEFKAMFNQLFGGGSAKLILVDAENLTDSGIEIEARLPGRREQGLALLSGGERSLTAVALIFSLLKVSPTPFCVLDEVDAMLDEANVGRFGDLLKELSERTQFIVITHNRNTVQISGVIYGVTMGRDSTSHVVSLRLDEVSEEMVGSSR